MKTLDVIKSDGSSETCNQLKKIIKKHSGKVLIALKLILALLTFFTATITVNYIKVENNLQACQPKNESDKKVTKPNTTSTTIRPTPDPTVVHHLKRLIQRHTNSVTKDSDTCWRIHKNQRTNIKIYKFLCSGFTNSKGTDCEEPTALCDKKLKTIVEKHRKAECHCLHTTEWGCLHP
ncbi:small hydrophobic protein [human metapneumovirus]|uniref:Small hydrophobic protein n=1 Tax=human metapneumovirus TaxID=162145 RepID=Q6E7F8_9MONO|nr:small hydrophobic protein [Human metapneumovirus]